MSTYETLRLLIWVFGVPTIVALSVRAVRRVRAIRQRHEALLQEAAKNPQDAYAQLAQLYQEKPRR